MPHATTLRLPPNGKLEFEVTAGVWVDVTRDIDHATSPVTIRYGRASEFSQPQPAAFTVTLINDGSKQSMGGAAAGAYTPQNPASPYYPNIQRRKRIRYSYNTGTQRFRFFGYIKQWQPLMADGWRPMMQITAACRMDQLQRVKMLSPITQEISLDSPTRWWPLTDAQGSMLAMEQSGNGGPPLGLTGAPTFGDNGPGFGDGTGVKFTGSQFLVSSKSGLLSGLISGSNTFEVWANTTSATDGAVLSFSETTLFGTFQATIAIMGATNGGKGRLTGASVSSTINGTTNLVDGGWHHLAAVCSSGTWTFYVDGVSAGTSGSAVNFPPNLIRVGQADTGSSSMLFTGNIGQVATYAGVALSSTRIQAHAAAGFGYFGDRTDVRISRFLGYAGLTASDWNLDTGQVTVNTYPQDGKDALSACQDMATSEGAGAVLYVTPDGKARFPNRRYRDNRTPVLIINAVDDLDPTVYSPSLDDLNLVTQVTVDRASESGSQTSQTYNSGAADVFASQVTTYTTTDSDALALAQYMVNAQTTAALRFPQIAVDLARAGHNLYDQVGQLQIGDRIRLTNIPAAAYPVATLDFFVEGWTETAGLDSYQVVFDVTAADNPGKRWQWDVSTWDGGDVWAL